MDGQTWWNQYTPYNFVAGGIITIKYRPHMRAALKKKNFISCLPVKRGGSLSFLTIFTFAVPELLDLIWRKIGILPYVVPPWGLYKEEWFLMGFYLISFELAKIQMYDFAVCFVNIYYCCLQKYTGFTMSVRPSVRPSVDKSYVVR
jgi:hypothetical protein